MKNKVLRVIMHYNSEKSRRFGRVLTMHASLVLPVNPEDGRDILIRIV
jgi:hypothetical protein